MSKIIQQYTSLGDILENAAKDGGTPVMVVSLRSGRCHISISHELRFLTEESITSLAETICEALTNEISIRRQIEQSESNKPTQNQNFSKGD